MPDETAPNYQFTIREATPDDAAALIAFMKAIADEPDNGISYDSANEFTVTIEEERELLQKYHEANNSLYMVAVDNQGRIVGQVNAFAGRRGYTSTLELAIAVAQDWRDHGVGTALMKRLIAWCQDNPIVHRLHLMVFPNNPRAIHLYEKLGFQYEGTWRSAYKKEGKWLDLIQMAMIFDHDGATTYDDDAAPHDGTLTAD